MCSVIFLRRPGHDWPLILGANRDEMAERPWRPPARHWPDRAIVAGLDELAGGTWLGINDAGVVAGVLNRPGTLGPAAGLRSRGELPLEALDHEDAADAAAALERLDGASWRPFNMFVADNRDAFWIRSLGNDRPDAVTVAEIPPGLSMLTAHDLNDTASKRIRFYRPRFAAASPPDLGRDDWTAWERLLMSDAHEPGGGPADAMRIVTPGGFGTTSSSLIALPAVARKRAAKPVWRFAAAPFESPRYCRVSL